MEKYNLWPYEELTVTKIGDTRSFRFETPWYASEIHTSDSGADIINNLFIEKKYSDYSKEEIFKLLNSCLLPLIHEPYSYIISDFNLISDEYEIQNSLTDLNDENDTPQKKFEHYGLDSNFCASQWSWDLQSIFQMTRLDKNFYSPVSLYSTMRRFFYLEASEKDQTKNLYNNLPHIIDNSDQAKNILAYIINQNLYVTQQCEKVLNAALPFADDNAELLHDFMISERGHDQIMQNAINAFPNGVAPWALEVHKSTRHLMDLFHQIAKNDFFAFAFSIYLFERPHFEKYHPVTQLLKKYHFANVAEKYETHHIINNKGNHDQIAFKIIQNIKPLSFAEAKSSVRWIEAMTWAITAHSENLLKSIINSKKF